MPLDMALTPNRQDPLRVGPSQPFVSNGVLHVVLDVASTTPLQFELKYIPSNGETDVARYVKNLPFAAFNRTEAPFDIVLDKTNAHQQWILVQLGINADWCFSADGPAVSCKGVADGRVFDPHWVDGNGDGQPGDIPIGQNGCKLIWFGLAELDDGASLGLNYHVTVSQAGKLPDGTPIVKHMQIIFDPDVRNDGGRVIP